MIRPGAGSAMAPAAPLERPATGGIAGLCDTAPSGPIATRWERRRAELDLVGPIRRRRHQVVVVGAGLAGASAAATLSELGYRVRCLCFHDSPRRAHSVAAQGGINAAKNYQNDGDSVERLFHDTLKGGDFRSRESNVYRLAELSARIIDHAVAQGVPFAREYGGQLANRSFGGALVSRTFYARGQTGQQLLLGAYQALAKEEAAGGVTMLPRREMLDLVVVDGRARGVIARDLVSGARRGAPRRRGGARHRRATRTPTSCPPTRRPRTPPRSGARTGAARRSPIPASCSSIPRVCPRPALRRPSSRSCRSRCATTAASGCRAGRATTAGPRPSRRPSATTSSSGATRATATSCPATSASRAVKAVCDEGRGVGPGERGVYLDLGEAAVRLGAGVLRERYGNLFEMYEHITGDDPLRVAMRIAPAAHYTMGGLWVDYDLMSTIPGLFVIGEANFSDHGANRLGASALMQGLADGYFILPYTLAGYLAGARLAPCRRGCRRGASGAGRRPRARRDAAGRAGTAHGRRVSPGARPSAMGRVRDRAEPPGTEQGPRRDRRAPRGVLGGRDRVRRRAPS